MGVDLLLISYRNKPPFFSRFRSRERGPSSRYLGQKYFTNIILTIKVGHGTGCVSLYTKISDSRCGQIHQEPSKRPQCGHCRNLEGWAPEALQQQTRAQLEPKGRRL